MTPFLVLSCTTKILLFVHSFLRTFLARYSTSQQCGQTKYVRDVETVSCLSFVERLVYLIRIILGPAGPTRALRHSVESLETRSKSRAFGACACVLTAYRPDKWGRHARNT
jgi:hypothetical protein